MTEKTIYERTFDNVLGKANDEIKRSIDAYIMVETLVQSGWHKVVCENMDTRKAKWIARNLKKSLKGKYYGFYSHYAFELEEDAVYFTMRWK